MPASKAQQRAVSKYMAANYDEIKLRVPKGQREEIRAFAAARGESVNGLFSRLIADAMAADSAEGRQP